MSDEGRHGTLSACAGIFPDPRTFRALASHRRSCVGDPFNPCWTICSTCRGGRGIYRSVLCAKDVRPYSNLGLDDGQYHRAADMHLFNRRLCSGMGAVHARWYFWVGEVSDVESDLGDSASRFRCLNLG